MPQLVNHCHLTASSSILKSQIKQIVVIHLVDKEIIPSLEVTEEIVRDERGLMGEKVLHLRHFELVERKKEQEAQLRLRKLKFKEKELSLQLIIKDLEVKLRIVMKQ